MASGNLEQNPIGHGQIAEGFPIAFDCGMRCGNGAAVVLKRSGTALKIVQRREA